jgi:hypothetical protein
MTLKCAYTHKTRTTGHTHMHTYVYKRTHTHTTDSATSQTAPVSNSNNQTGANATTISNGTVNGTNENNSTANTQNLTSDNAPNATMNSSTASHARVLMTLRWQVWLFFECVFECIVPLSANVAVGLYLFICHYVYAAPLISNMSGHRTWDYLSIYVTMSICLRVYTWYI